MKLKVLAPNMTQIDNGKYRVLFSYETPVAAFDSSGTAFKTSQKFSATTSKHISKFLGTDAKSATEKPQSFFNSLSESKVKNMVAESLEIQGACEFLDAMNSFRPLVENFDGDESLAEEDPDKRWYSSGDGKLEFQMSLDQARSVSQPGKDAEEDVRALMQDPDMKDVVEYLKDNMEAVREELRGTGAWDEDELADDDMSIVRLLWLAGNDITEGAFDTEIDETYEELDIPDEDMNEENDLNEGSGEELHLQDVISSTDIEEKIQSLEGSDSEELAELQKVKSEVVDYLSEDEWESGVQLIRDSYFSDYIEEEARDLDSELFNKKGGFPYMEYIDWDRVARDMEINDYSSTEINGIEYKFRSH